MSAVDLRGSGRRSPTAGNRGNGSKWIRRAKRLRIYARDGHRCVWCGTADVDRRLTLDHVLPRSLGGTNDTTNLITCCNLCNASRADAPGHEFARRVAARAGLAPMAVAMNVIAAIMRPLPPAPPSLT